MIEAEVHELTPQPTAAVRVRQPLSEMDLAALFATHLPNIADRLGDMGVDPAGPPYGRYHEFGPERVDVEIGIPLQAPASALRPLAETEEGELGSSELPGGRAAVAVHRGSYDGLPAVSSSSTTGSTSRDTWRDRDRGSPTSTTRPRSPTRPSCAPRSSGPSASRRGRTPGPGRRR
jgi:effector-binding domain-containing protein